MTAPAYPGRRNASSLTASNPSDDQEGGDRIRYSVDDASGALAFDLHFVSPRRPLCQANEPVGPSAALLAAVMEAFHSVRTAMLADVYPVSDGSPQ